MKKIYLSIFVMLFLVSFVCSLDSVGTIGMGESFELRQECDCTYVTFQSVYSPSGDLLLSNASALNNGHHFYYGFNNTLEQGEYVVSGFGDPDGQFTTFAYTFKVERTDLLGFDFNSSYTLVFVVIFFLLGFLFFFLKKPLWSGAFLFIDSLILIFNDFLNFISIILFCISVLLLLAGGRK
jgi:hypothetical protein